MGRGAGNLARDAAEGAIIAVNEVGGEAGAFLKDAVIGVVEGTAQVVTVTTPAVREAVIGAVRGSSRLTDNVAGVGRDAVVRVAPYNRDSGPHRGKRTVRGGRSRVRAVLYMGALVASRWNPVIREFYQRLLATANPKKLTTGQSRLNGGF